MQFGTVLGLVGATVALCGFAWIRQWMMALACLFSLAYTVFGKVFPALLPELLVTSFALVFLGLVLLHFYRSIPRVPSYYAEE